MNAQKAPANLRRFALTADSLRLDRVTRTTTRELVEALTDPDGSAVLDIPGTCRQGGWCEIADICRPAGRIDGVLVPSYWSNISGDCAPATPNLTRSRPGLLAHQVRPAAAPTMTGPAEHDDAVRAGVSSSPTKADHRPSNRKQMRIEMTETATKPLTTAVDYLKQWMIDPNHQHHRPLRPKTPFSGPDDHTHSLLNQRTRTFLRQQQTSGGRLEGTATTVTRWFFTRASEEHSPLRYGEPVAMGYGTNAAYLHYPRRSVGAGLAWSDQPRFEWELLGRVSGQPARSGDWLALYNRERGDCLTYFDHAVGGDIGWPSSETWSGPPQDPVLTAVQQHWDEALIWLLAA